jgi:hypothetical protein
MPWKIVRDFGDCNGYAVVKEGTSEIEGCHATRAAAVAQQRALYASENKSMHSDEEDERRGKRKNELRKRSVVENHPNCDGGFGVVSDDDGELKGCYPTRSAAEEAIRQHDMEDDDGIDNVWSGAFSPKKKK